VVRWSGGPVLSFKAFREKLVFDGQGALMGCDGFCREA
jgi:hypothetical protein